MVLSTTLVAIPFTWLYNNTGKSILAVLLLHTMFNLSHYVFPTLSSDRGSLYLLGLLFVAGILILRLGALGEKTSHLHNRL
ncbi:MAG: hypothetical protein HC849_19520 [Oscillatoriales cyanobacterium RU_3_3]|nr:hypothetical protein [Oscillatoriales cyanobacterium RU_3_3]